LLCKGRIDVLCGSLAFGSKANDEYWKDTAERFKKVIKMLYEKNMCSNWKEFEGKAAIKTLIMLKIENILNEKAIKTN
jgi:hypothetical protein